MKPFKQWKTSLKWVAGIFLLFLIGGIGSVSWTVWQVYQTASTMYHPVERLPSQPRQQAAPVPEKEGQTPAAKEPAPPQASDLGVQTFLFVGIDQDADSSDVGRADVIMLAVLNGSTKTLTLTSIPRDTYVEIAEKKYKDKINHSYRYGMEAVIATVENFTDMLVDHYVSFNFDGFKKTVDSIGGLTLDLDPGVAKELQLPVGQHHLNGSQALEYARFRGDAMGDFRRNARQQDVLKAALEQGRDVILPGKLQEILDTLGTDMRTDLTFAQMVALATQMSHFSKSQVEIIKYEAHSERFGPQNLSYVMIAEQERERVMKLLKQAAATPD